MKTWQKDFRTRAKAIPRNRRAENIRTLRQLIREMYEADFGVAEIGRLLERDHTTIVHHLAFMGFHPQQENRAKKADYYQYRLLTERQKTERIKVSLEARKKTQALQAARSIAYQEKLARIKENRIMARTLYRKGVALRKIAKKFGVSIPGAQFLIFGDRKLQPKHRRVFRFVQQFDIAGNLIATHRSISAASLSSNCKYHSIQQALTNGNYKTGGGFVWKYV